MTAADELFDIEGDRTFRKLMDYVVVAAIWQRHNLPQDEDVVEEEDLGKAIDELLAWERNWSKVVPRAEQLLQACPRCAEKTSSAQAVPPERLEFLSALVAAHQREGHENP